MHHNASSLLTLSTLLFISGCGSDPADGSARGGSSGNTAGATAGTGGGTTDGTAGQVGGRAATGSAGGARSNSGGAATSNSTGGVDENGGASSRGGASTGNGGSASGGATATGGQASAGSGMGGRSSGGTAATGGAIGGSATGGSAGSTARAVIRNDVFWKDTSGNFIYSQGGGVIRVGDTYYWYGVKYNGAVTYAANPTGKNSDTSFAGVTIYSSKDLATWKHENTVTFSNAGAWFGRLGVVYNANTKKYVMIAQGAGGLFFATSDTPTGNFVFDNVATNLTGIVNGSTGDQTTFQDDDGKAYLICSSSSGRSNLYVVPLRASDFLAIGTPTRIFGGAGREGNALFKYNGRYYFCSSDLHGWNASHTYCVSATNILGPYGSEFVMTNTDPDFSHVTQTGFFITVKGTAGSFVIFAGDRWSDFAGNGLGYNQWMPLTFDGANPIFQSLSEWNIDAAAGTWSVGANNNYAANPSFEADRVAVTTPAGWTTTNGTNIAGGHSGRWSWQLTGAASLDQKQAALPNGTYTLRAWVKGSGATGAQLYAKGCGGTDQTVSLSNANGTWANVSLPGIAVSGGNCRIGVTTTAGSLTIDDFTLIKN
jgi:hypothetical protein